MHDGPNLAKMSAAAAAVELQGKKEREQRTKGEVKKSLEPSVPSGVPSPLPSPLLLLPKFPNVGSRRHKQSDLFQTVPYDKQLFRRNLHCRATYSR